MTRPPQPERRRAPRLDTRIPMSLGARDAELLTTTHNISATGAYCTVRRFLPPMTKLQVRLEIPSNGRPIPVACEGIVVRVDPPLPRPRLTTYRVAIFFQDLPERDRSALTRFVAQRLEALLRRG